MIITFSFTEDNDVVKKLPKKTKTKELNLGVVKVTEGSELTKLCVKSKCRFCFE